MSKKERIIHKLIRISKLIPQMFLGSITITVGCQNSYFLFPTPRQSNEDEFSRKSNGGWIFLGIKQGLQGFCLDFLGNQTRMNFPENRMGDGFSWESNGGCKKNNNNNNMIRLVPVRIESGRGK